MVETAGKESNVIVSSVGLVKEFRDFWNRPKAKAVNDLDFEVREGEVLGLLGPNGSGKSTTVKMLLGLLYPTAGRLTVFGKSPRDVDTKRLIGYLPEESYLYKYLTAYETLDFFGSLFNLSGAERKKRSEQLLEMVGLTHAKNRPVGEFSKGMSRRIGLAQAMINDPSLLILDEPTSGLDPLGCREVKDLIHMLKRRGKTVIVTSHLLSDIEDVCDRVIILYGGRISIIVGLGSALGAALLGVTLGLYVGYKGGLMDNVLIKISDIFQSIPQMVLIIIMVALVGQSMENLIIIFILTGWPGMYRMARSKVLSLKQQEFVQALRAFGISDLKIAFKHLLPNTLGPVVVNITLSTAMFILQEAALSVLGYGVPMEIATWGNIINVITNGGTIRFDWLQYWWMWLPCSIMLILFVLAINFVGDGLRDASDPTQIG